MITLVFTVIGEGVDIIGVEPVFRQDAGLHGLVLPRDHAPRLWVIRSGARMLHPLGMQPFKQIARDVTEAFTAQQSWLVDDVQPKLFGIVWSHDLK